MKFYKFTPALLDPKILEKTLVGRDIELDNLKRILKSASTGKSLSHAILVGQKGIGKSHILRILYHGVRGEIKTKELNSFKDKFIPVIFSEEEYPGNITKFIKLVMHYLSESGYAGIPEIPKAMKNAGSLTTKEREIAFDYIRTFKKKTGKALLLLVDNLNDIIERFTDEDQSSLRGLLMSYDSMLLIGSAPTLFDSIINHSRPLYNFFEIIWLKDLPFEESVTLLKRYAEIEGRKEVNKELKEKEAKLRAIHELGGGNPRLILSLYHIIVEGDISSVENTFLKLLDDLSPYFRERMKDLSDQQQEIVDTMARAEFLLTPTEIAERCHMPVNVVNSQLKRLEKVGFVRVEKKYAKKAFYDFNERLFSLWRQMRVEAGRNRLGFIVRFLEIWFTKEELHIEADKLSATIMKYFASGEFDKLEPQLNKFWYLKEALPELANAYMATINGIENIKHKHKDNEDRLCRVLGIDCNKEPLFGSFYWLLFNSFSLSVSEVDLSKELLKKALKLFPKANDKNNFFRYLSLALKWELSDKRTQIIKVLIEETAAQKQVELLDFLSPYSTLIKYLETKDKEVLDRLRHEERLIVDEMLKMLEEKG